MVEHRFVVPTVAGSNPVSHPVFVVLWTATESQTSGFLFPTVVQERDLNGSLIPVHLFAKAKRVCYPVSTLSTF